MEAYLEWQKEIEPYLRVYPLFSNQAEQEPDGNPVLYSSIAIIIEVDLFGADEHAAKFTKDLYANAKKAPGILTRGRHKAFDTQEHDDPMGLIGASVFSGYIEPAQDIYLAGKKSGWVYNEGVYKSNSDIGRYFENWYNRFPGFVGLAKLGASEKLNLWDKLSFAASLLTFSGESGIQLDWIKIKVYQRCSDKSWLIDQAVSYWQNKVRKKYPLLMGDVFKIYYGEGHVFTKWMKGRF